MDSSNITPRTVKVTMRGEVNSIPEGRNCIFEVTQRPQGLETSNQGVSETVKTSGFVRVTMRGEVSSTDIARSRSLSCPKRSKELLRLLRMPGL